MNDNYASKSTKSVSDVPEYPFYKQYPEMRPFIGNNYGEAKQHGCALLVIGESHYLQGKSTIHHNATSWYKRNDSFLNKEERGWINTSGVVDEAIAIFKDKKRNDAFTIFKSSAMAINEFGPRLPNYLDVFKYIVFYNYFLRPADYGDSIKNIIVPQDVSVAQDYFEYMLMAYNPDGIVFLSRFAFEQCSKAGIKIPIAGAPHPGCYWWNKKSKKYGNRYGREVVQDALVNMDWTFCNTSGRKDLSGK